MPEGEDCMDGRLVAELDDVHVTHERSEIGELGAPVRQVLTE